MSHFIGVHEHIDHEYQKYERNFKASLNQQEIIDWLIHCMNSWTGNNYYHQKVQEELKKGTSLWHLSYEKYDNGERIFLMKNCDPCQFGYHKPQEDVDIDEL